MRKRPPRRETRKPKRDPEPEKPDGLPEVAAPTPQWQVEMQRRRQTLDRIDEHFRTVTPDEFRARLNRASPP